MDENENFESFSHSFEVIAIKYLTQLDLKSLIDYMLLKELYLEYTELKSTDSYNHFCYAKFYLSSDTAKNEPFYNCSCPTIFNDDYIKQEIFSINDFIRRLELYDEKGVIELKLEGMIPFIRFTNSACNTFKLIVREDK